MPVVDIFLDSCVLRAIKPHGQEARVLRELAMHGALKIHISTIVEREVATGLADDIKLQCRSIGWASDTKREGLEAAAKLIRNAGPAIEEGVKEWLDGVGVRRHHSTSEETKRVFDAYFGGAEPFKSRKARDDLPDAFLLECLRTYAETAPGTVRFVSMDSRLAAAAAKIPNVAVHSDLLNLLVKIDVERPLTTDEMRDFCKENESEIQDYLYEGFSSALDGREVINEDFPSENGDATVTGTGTISGLDFEFGDAEVLGTDVIAIPFNCSVEDCLLDLYVYKGDYGSLDDLEYSASDWNEHYMLAQTHKTLLVEGRVLAQVVSRQDPRGAARILEFGDLEVEVTEVEVRGSKS